MATFLHGRALSSEILRLMRGDNVRCAVAFWGDGAVLKLFGRAYVPSPSVRVVCDLSMGGTNPSELKKLGAPDCASIRHFEALHAKMYLADSGLIVGSANASNNGIGFLDEAGLVEAGAHHSAGSAAWEEAAAWFEALFKTALIVDEEALVAAQESWRRRRQSAKTQIPTVYGASKGALFDPASLLETVTADPERFRGFGFVFTEGQSTTAHRDEAADALIRNDRKKSTPALRKSDVARISDWSVGRVFSEWEPEDISAWPLNFVCCHRGGSGQIAYYFYERTHPIVTEDGTGYVLAAPKGDLRTSNGFRKGCKIMADTDAPRLARLFDYLSEDGHRLCESGEKLVQLLEAAEIR